MHAAGNEGERPLHILIIPSWYSVTPLDVRGSFFREQAQALQRAGCKVGVVYPQLRSMRQWQSILSGQYGVSEEYDGEVVTLRAHSMSWFPKMPRLIGAQWVRSAAVLYEHYIKKFGAPDLIHAHSLLYAGCAAYDLHKRWNIPYVVTEHSSAYARSMLDTWQHNQVLTAAKEAQRRFAVSPPFCELLTKYFNCADIDWMPLPNIVRQDFLDAPLYEESQTGKFTFLHVSLLGKKKSVDNLIHAYAKAFSSNTSVILKIGGKGEELLRLQALAQALGVSEQVQFIGGLSRGEVLSEMRTCHAFVLPSQYETFGVVVVEALALGKPVIATRCGGPESIIDNDSGLLVPVDDIEGLTQAMRDIFKNYKRYDAKAIRASCEARYSESTVTSSLITQYRTILKEY